jgi:hypothetical protein
VLLKLDILKVGYESKNLPRNKYPLKTYTGLSSLFTSFSSSQRLGLLSETKSHEVTHRRDRQIANAEESDICLDNGLVYKFYDDRSECFVDACELTDEVPKSCMYKLPAQSSSLQQFLFRPAADFNGPPPNVVIASQSQCPAHISLDEFKALGSIPQPQLQWQNILLQLSVPVVDFKTIETNLVILQSIYQTGPPDKSNFLRVGHDIVDDEMFAHSLLGALHEALNRVKENWESCNALSIFISLASRSCR